MALAAFETENKIATTNNATVSIQSRTIANDNGKQLIYDTMEKSPIIKELDNARGDRSRQEFLRLARRVLA